MADLGKGMGERGSRLVSLAFLLALIPAGLASAQEGVDKTGMDVLRSTPFDRITLIDGKVILVEPISPRPLPPYDPKKDPKNQKPASVPRQGNIFLPGEREKLGLPDEMEKPESTDVFVHLLEGDMRDFRLRRASIRKVDYFEDMLIAEGERRTLSRDFTKAFECLLRVQTRQPGWEGLESRVDRFLFEEGSMALVDGNGEQGLRLLRELFQRKPKFPGLADKLASAYSARARKAFDVGAFAKGRSILHELETLAPDHSAYIGTRDLFITKARTLTEAAASQPAPKRIDSLTEALRVWPKLDDAVAKYNIAFAAMPTLDVAVTDIPRPLGPWVHSPADERTNRLLYVPVLARDDEDAFRGKAPGQLASSIELSDVGRKLIFKIKGGVMWSDGSRPVSAIDVARLFTDRTESSSPLYNARWAGVLERVETPDDSRVEVRLSRAF
ncbi:ABC transporter substrate-binding protein, partial [Singulisphaera rosea]